MDTYPSLDRVKAEQQLRKEKLELTSALLDLRGANLKVASLGQYEEELHKVNVLKNRFVESVHQFLNLFGHEVCDDDRILYKNEIIDIERKVQEHSDEIRKQAKDMKALEHYRTILDKERSAKGNKLETILEMCKEIDDNCDGEETREKSSSSTRSSNGHTVPHVVALPDIDSTNNNSEEDKPGKPKNGNNNHQGKKSTFSYSVKKEVTETMTVTEEH